MKCTNCGIELYALNMDDDDSTLCQDCAGEIKDKLFFEAIHDDTTMVLWERK